MKTFKVRYLAAVMLMALFFAQSAAAEYETLPLSSSSGSIAVVMAIAVGAVLVGSSVDCASESPSIPSCQPGGSSARGGGPRAPLGLMGSFVSR